MNHHPLDWDRDGRVGMGDGAFTEMVHGLLTGPSGADGNQTGCSCGCMVWCLALVVVLITILIFLGGS